MAGAFRGLIRRRRLHTGIFRPEAVGCDNIFSGSGDSGSLARVPEGWIRYRKMVDRLTFRVPIGVAQTRDHVKLHVQKGLSGIWEPVCNAWNGEPSRFHVSRLPLSLIHI